MSKLSFLRSGFTFRRRLLLRGLFAGAFLLTTSATHAMTFTVNSTADVPDVNPGNGVCETAPGNGTCTLRGAIQEANALAGADTIVLQPNVTYTLSRIGADDTALNGDLDILDSVTIIGAGPGSTIIDGNGGVIGERVFQIAQCSGNAAPPCNAAHPAVVVTMSGVTIENGNSQNVGGGLFNNGTLTMTNCTVSNNIATGINEWGGGIYNSGQLNLIKSTVANNTAGSASANNAYGGAIYNQGPMVITDSTISGNTVAGTPAYGGGIFNIGTASTIRNSTISGNTAVSGGGIYKVGLPVVITNSTISGNRSLGSGGGVYASSGAASLYNATVTQNRANSDASGGGEGGGVAAGSGATLTFQNSIIAYNEILIPTGGLPILANDDCAGTVSSEGHNIMHDVDSSYCTVNGAVTITDPMLGALASNGGATQTHALLIGSPAINAGNAAGCTDDLGASLPSDQREYHRPDGTPCDIGAFEFGATIPVTLANISTRLRVESGDNALIGGFIISGTQQKRVIVRAIGPSLSSLFSGVLADPFLELRNSAGGLVASNDNWRSDHEAEIIATGVQPGNDLESAIVATLPANNSTYTAIVRGVNNGTGIGVVEAYDLDRTIDSRLANISTRGLVSTGDNVMIGGAIILGNTPANVLIRGIGPSLAGSGIPNPLPDPTLELHDSNGALLASNDNWRSDQEAEIIATTIPPTNDLESAILQTLAPGLYTAILRGKNNSTGVAVVEAYQLQ